MTSGGTLGPPKNFLRSLSLAIFYGPLINSDIIRPLPRPPSRLGRSVYFSVSIHSVRCFRCLELGPPTFQTKVTPLSLSQSKIWLESPLSCLSCSVTAIRPLCENMTSSTKPEVHNVSQRRQRRAEPQSQATFAKNSAMWFSSYVSRQTHKHTHSPQYFTPFRVRSKNTMQNRRSND